MSLSGVGLLGWYEQTLSTIRVATVLHCVLTGPNGQPKVTHGSTLVSDLLLDEVVQTIDVSIIYSNT